MIGKLEELVLLGALRAGPSALASEVYERVLLGQPKASFGKVYTTLERLTVKGLLDEVARSDGKARARRGFTISGSGRMALADALDASAAVGGYSSNGGDYVTA
jgi:DNA-binding PadR family transcriptional regulator